MFDDLWVSGDVEDDGEVEHQALRELSESGNHIHGPLAIEINGRRLPRLEFFPGDVCVGEWACELRGALQVLRADKAAKFVFDEGEQDQPAYVFEREGDVLLVSVAASDRGGARAEPGWQRVACPFADFESAVEEFLAAFRRRLTNEAPSLVDEWWRTNVERGC